MESNTEIVHLRQQLQEANIQLAKQGELLIKAAELSIKDAASIEVLLFACKVHELNVASLKKQRDQLTTKLNGEENRNRELVANIDKVTEEHRQMCVEYNKAFPWLVTSYPKDGICSAKRFQKLDDAAHFGASLDAPFDVLYTP